MLNEHFERSGLDPRATWPSPRTWSTSCWPRAARSRPSTARAGSWRPFVRRQYGDELYEVMREIKRLFDPHGLLNPGVLIDDDPAAHSATSSRRRPSRSRSTAAWSAATASRSARARTSPPRRGGGSCCAARWPAPGPPADAALLAELERGLPVRRGRHLRRRRHVPDRLPGADQHRRPDHAGCAASGRSARPKAAAWTWAARRWAAGTRVGGGALTALETLPDRPVTAARPRSPGDCSVTDTVPRYDPDLPRGGPVRRPRPAQRAGRRLLPGLHRHDVRAAESGPGVQDAFLDALRPGRRRGARARAGSTALCCGTPWKSKGHDRGLRGHARDQVPCPLLAAATDGGALPVVADAASCTEGLRRAARRTPAGASMQVRRRRAVRRLSVLLPRLPPASGAYPRWPCTHLLVNPAWASTRPASGGGGRGRRGRGRPTTGAAAPSPATAGCCTRS